MPWPVSMNSAHAQGHIDIDGSAHITHVAVHRYGQQCLLRTGTVALMTHHVTYLTRKALPKRPDVVRHTLSRLLTECVRTVCRTSNVAARAARSESRVNRRVSNVCTERAKPLQLTKRFSTERGPIDEVLAVLQRRRG